MKRVHQPENHRSIAGSGYDSSDEDETRSFCYSPQDEDQRRRFCDLVALALTTSRDHGSVQPQSASWEGDASDSESHPSLESDAEAELLDLFDEEEENESGCFVESEPSTSPSVDGSFESYDATVIQNRKLSLLSRQQRQHASFRERGEQGFRETNSFCMNHANVLSPELMIVVERLLKDNRRSSSREKAKDKMPDPQSSSRGAKSPIVHRSHSTVEGKKEQQLETLDEVAKNATVMDHLRKLVYKKYDNSKPDQSETESIRSSILPLSPSLLSYRDALRHSSTRQNKPSENVQVPARTIHEGALRVGFTGGADPMSAVPVACSSVAPILTNSAGSSQVLMQRVPETPVLPGEAHGAVGPSGADPLQTAASEKIGESNLTLSSTSVSPAGGNLVTGRITRSMVRNGGEILLTPAKLFGRERKQPRSTRLRQSELNLPETLRSTVNPIDPVIPNVKISAANSNTHSSNDPVNVASTAEQEGSETFAITTEMAPSVNSKSDSGRRT